MLSRNNRPTSLACTAPHPRHRQQIDSIGNGQAAGGTEILWDTFGIPHIFASDHASLFRAYGYAQMEAHSELLLSLYAQAQGRGAEFYGASAEASGSHGSDTVAGTKLLDADRWVRTYAAEHRNCSALFIAGQLSSCHCMPGANQRHPGGGQALGRGAEPRVRPAHRGLRENRPANHSGCPHLCARHSLVSTELSRATAGPRQAGGINDWAGEHPDQLSTAAAAVLTALGGCRAEHVHAHCLRVIHYDWIVSPQRLQARLKAAAVEVHGSNEWAIGPTRSATGNAMLLSNSHLQWGDRHTYFEVHLNAPGVNSSGVPAAALALLGGVHAARHSQRSMQPWW